MESKNQENDIKDIEDISNQNIETSNRPNEPLPGCSSRSEEDQTNNKINTENVNSSHLNSRKLGETFSSHQPTEEEKTIFECLLECLVEPKLRKLEQRCSGCKHQEVKKYSSQGLSRNSKNNPDEVGMKCLFNTPSENKKGPKCVQVSEICRSKPNCFEKDKITSPSPQQELYRELRFVLKNNPSISKLIKKCHENKSSCNSTEIENEMMRPCRCCFDSDYTKPTDHFMSHEHNEASTSQVSHQQNEHVNCCRTNNHNLYQNINCCKFIDAEIPSHLSNGCKHIFRGAKDSEVNYVTKNVCKFSKLTETNECNSFQESNPQAVCDCFNDYDSARHFCCRSKESLIMCSECVFKKYNMLCCHITNPCCSRTPINSNHSSANRCYSINQLKKYV